MHAEKMQPGSGSSISILVRHKLLYIGYTVEFEVRKRKISYTIGYENIVTAMAIAAFSGLLIFKGDIDTYIFWASVISAAGFWLNNVITHGRIKQAVKRSLPIRPDSQGEGLPSTACSITQQMRCSACGCVLTGFGPMCPGCGIRLGQGTESASRLCGWRLKYFFRDKS